MKKSSFVLRRLGFGTDINKLSELVNYSPSDLIDKIIDDAKSLDVSDPGWANWTASDFNESGRNRGQFFRDHQRIVFRDLLNNGFRDRLTLFGVIILLPNITCTIIPHMHSDITTTFRKMFLEILKNL